ncbi:M20 family peptidase [Psychrosphaera sp. F3M07]|uniref:M20 family peptidase n=1 Tax=Psychrosphaera sp. F3M07 TaxID=2841560 RepID=UPI001C093B51|nr:M20 family peptidase [Psychrosphaera sp. F3M07]MBU2918341.1 M20 family peptidase [Psychrosphaera sp. F3M07]
MLKKITNILLSCILILIAIILVRTITYDAPEPIISINKENPELDIDPMSLANNLSAAIQFKTISKEDQAQIDKKAFNRFVDWVRSTYPLVHKKLQLIKINQHTLVFYWRGLQPEKPAILMSAHYDVVPVNPGTEQDWQHAPFDGVIDQEYIWGRGAMDDKGSAIAMLEAINALANKDFKPQGDIYVALTHDEEIGSQFGAQAVANWLAKKKVDIAWSLDEGSAVIDGIVPGITKQIAMINVAEKGYLNLELVANAEGGHSSMPPKDTAVSILADGIVKLRDNPVAGGLTGVSEIMYDKLGRHMSLGYRILFANTWLFKPIIEKVMGDIPSGNAMLRTTTAPTMLTGSIKSNVLPISATAIVNFRLHPRDTIDDVINHVKRVINDERIEVNTVTAQSASTIATMDSSGFNIIAEQASAAYGDVIVTPGITIAATDSRFYSEITQSYRFSPMILNKQDLARMHGTNERISIDNMVKAVRFYAGIMRQQ